MKSAKILLMDLRYVVKAATALAFAKLGFNKLASKNANRLVALRCEFVGGWYIFPDSPSSFYSLYVNLPQG